MLRLYQEPKIMMKTIMCIWLSRGKTREFNKDSKQNNATGMKKDGIDWNLKNFNKKRCFPRLAYIVQIALTSEVSLKGNSQSTQIENKVKHRGPNKQRIWGSIRTVERIGCTIKYQIRDLRTSRAVLWSGRCYVEHFWHLGTCISVSRSIQLSLEYLLVTYLSKEKI